MKSFFNITGMSSWELHQSTQQVCHNDRLWIDVQCL